MKPFFSMFCMDLKIVIRNNFIWFLLIALAVMTATVHLIPADPKSEAREYFYDTTEGKKIELFLKEKYSDRHFVGSLRELEEVTSGNRDNIGIMIKESSAKPVFTFLYNGEIQKETINITKASFEKVWEAAAGRESKAPFKIRYLREESTPVSVNKLAIPALITFEVIILGFLFIAVMVFQEKQEGSIRAYRVSPGGIWVYILSKTTVWVVFTILYGFFFIILTMGPAVNWLQILALLFMSGLFMTLLGLIVSVFFKNISEWFFIGVGILVINMVPQISYLNPAFSPEWVTYIPSYPVLFTARDILFGEEPAGFIWPVLLRFGTYVLIALPIAYLAVRMKLMKEAR